MIRYGAQVEPGGAGPAVSLPGGRLSDRHLPSRRRRGGAAPQPDLRLTRAVAGALRLVSKTGAMTRGPGKGRIINMKAGITTETLKQESSRLQLRVARGALCRTQYLFQGRSRAVKTLISHRGAKPAVIRRKEPPAEWKAVLSTEGTSLPQALANTRRIAMAVETASPAAASGARLNFTNLEKKGVFRNVPATPRLRGVPISEGCFLR